MPADLWLLYQQMLRSRRFEETVTRLWEEGKISGEMHLSVGEEAIVAGVVLQLRHGDALALDHRGTCPMLMRGVDPRQVLKEFLGQPDGLCGGRGGHMHLFSREFLVASSGIVGSSGPAACGFAMAGRYLRPGSVAVAFFGEGAMNQGMLMESMNLTVAWKLPVVFVCKDSNWAITTRSESVTGGNLVERARSFGMLAFEVDGSDAGAVWDVAAQALNHARTQQKPAYIHATCVHPEGHFLGDPVLRLARYPIREMKKMAVPLIKSLLSWRGAPTAERTKSMGRISFLIGKSVKEQLFSKKDPLRITREKLQEDEARLKNLEKKVDQEIEEIRRAVVEV